MLSLLIPLLSAYLYRLDGADNGINYSRHVIGIPIAFSMGNWWYALSYFLAGFFVYGDNCIFSKLLGRKGSRILHGFTFGLASLDPLYAIWTAVVFYILFELAERGWIDNKYAEIGRGFFGTLIFAFK